MRMENQKRDLTFFLLYMFSFLLLWEWLRPLKELTDTGHLETFLAFVFVSLLMFFFGMPALLGAMIKIIFILYSVHFMYFEGTFFSSEWAKQFLVNIKGNFGLVAAAEWTELTSVFKTVLFFILLWLMAYLIQYWLISRKKIFVFFFMTLIYITVLDTFTPYEANAAIMRTVIAGFAVMGMLAYYRIADAEMMKKNLSGMRKWMVPLVAMILFSVGIGYAAPKADPIWPDPVPFITSYNEKSGGGGVQRVGYGTDDSELGGPFVGDDRIVFTAEAESRHYWRIETKEIYTGKGWLKGRDEDAPIFFRPQERVPLHPFDEEISTDERTSRVKPKIGYPHLVYPLGISKVDAPRSNRMIEFRMDPSTEKIYSVSDGEEGSIGPYSITYDKPVYNVDKMRAAGTGGVLPETEPVFYSQYTQLPEALPDRVGQLAGEIAAGKETWFDQAKAIESYFRSNEFFYDQTRVAVPAGDEDYVDQFLFETKRGYCDNFSTSMVIMLRSLGIPSRWVKGYTDGEYRDTIEGGYRVYEITNNNAHSWVEVYFPGVGWVPFEPTQGFSNNVQFEYNLNNNNNNDQEKDEDDNQAPVAPQKPEMPEEEKEAAKSKISFSEAVKKSGEFIETNMKKILLTVLVLAAFAGILYKTRAKWMPSFYILLYKYKKQNKHLEKAYLALLKQLARYGLKKENGQTLRDYADYVDSFFSSKEMRRLTAKYEEYLYRGNMNDRMWADAKKHWEIMMKKSSA